MQPTVVTLIRSAVAFTFLACALNLTAQTVQPAPDPATYEPITGKQRLKWYVKSGIGPVSLLTGIFSSGIGTATNSPREYGPHWEGFGKRYAMRFTGVGTSNAMEGGLGALWGEDPRYFRTKGFTFKQRVGNVVKMTFMAPRPDGHVSIAYARFAAIPGSNFLANTWRADSTADGEHAALRTLYGFLGRMGGNAFKEFWPDIRQHVFHRKP